MIDDPELFLRLGASLGIGLLMGLVRERTPGTLAGFRTYALVALLGSIAALLGERTGTIWMLPAGMLSLATMMIVAHLREQGAQDPGTTSTVAVLLCFCLGAMCWLGPLMPAVALGLLATALLHFKPELQGFATQLSGSDVRSILRFAVVSLLVLPLLPDRGYGPYGALNPYEIWLMVVLISGLSLGGYLLLQLIGQRHGVLLIGVLGGLVSSTATTLSFARQVRADPVQAHAVQAVILVANLVVLWRLAALAAVISPAVLGALLPVLASGFVAGALMAGLSLRRRKKTGTVGSLQIGNPGEMRAALGFALLYAAVLVVVAWLEQHSGVSGIYVAAAISGLTDVDAISLRSSA